MTEGLTHGFVAGRYAAIDIGTVTCRMLVADVDAAGAIHEVDREYAITNLGEGVDAAGVLAARRHLDGTVETVGGYCAVRDRLAEQGAPIVKTVAVATSASRDAEGTPTSSCSAWRSSASSFRSSPVRKRRGCRFRGPRAISRARTLWWWISAEAPPRWWWAVRGRRLRGRTRSISGAVALPRSSSAPTLPRSAELDACARMGLAAACPSVSGKPGRPAWRLSAWWRSRVRLPPWSRCATRCACTIRRRCIRRS